MDDSRPLIKDSLQIVTFVSLNPLTTNFKTRFFGRCVGLITVFTLADVCLYLSFNYQCILDSTVEILLLFGFSQNAIKGVFLVVYRDKLMVLINKISMFWKPKQDEFEQQKENNKTFLYIKYTIQWYIAFLLILCCGFLIKPLFFGAGELPWKSIFSRIFGHKIYYMLEFFQGFISYFTLLGFDTLYIAVITNIICEYKLLENCFPNLKINPSVRGTDKETMTELKNLIEHHILILECVKIMKHVYKFPMLGFFMLNMFGMCFALIIMTSSTSDNPTKMLFGMLTIFYSTQLFFYCICGSLLADESVKISVQAYNCKWYIKTQPELRKSLVMIIRRANEPEMLTAGGLFQVNLNTFRMIIRSTASYFTFIQLVYGKSE